VKIEQAVVLYLVKHKQISLQGIGTFRIDGTVPENSDNDKPVIIPAEAISFVYDPKIGEDPELVDFIVQNTKKIKPLASADLDSFLTLGRQFLNIGKPFTIQNLGTLDKLKSGVLEFKAGPLIQRVEVPKPKIEDDGAEKHEENLFNDYQRRPSSNNGKAVLFILAVIVIAGIAWAVWEFGFKKNNEESTTATVDKIVPVFDSAANLKRLDSIAAALKAADTVRNAQKTSVDSITFKVVVKETTNMKVAIARLQRLKSLGRDVIMYTDDSITYKVAQPFALPLSDTTRILDSLNKFYYVGRAHIETK
jgi:nucleoid DNA-binding protein